MMMFFRLRKEKLLPLEVALLQAQPLVSRRIRAYLRE
jgi:hypothetical protein